LVQHRMLHVAHLDAVSGQPPVAGAGGSRGSCYRPAGLAQTVEQQYRLRGIADRGGCREQLLGLLEGRGEDLTALTAARMARWLSTEGTKVSPDHLTAGESEVTPTSTNPQPAGERSWHWRRHPAILPSRTPVAIRGLPVAPSSTEETVVTRPVHGVGVALCRVGVQRKYRRDVQRVADALRHGLFE